MCKKNSAKQNLVEELSGNNSKKKIQKKSTTLKKPREGKRERDQNHCKERAGWRKAYHRYPTLPTPLSHKHSEQKGVLHSAKKNTTTKRTSITRPG